jgi:hypothetical protein
MSILLMTIYVIHLNYVYIRNYTHIFLFTRLGLILFLKNKKKKLI